MKHLELFQEPEIIEEKKIGETANLKIENRKYIGSKTKLISTIQKYILSFTNEINVFFDGFSGTGVVSHAFSRHSGIVIANDILYSNYVINRAFLCANSTNYSKQRVMDIVAHLNSISPIESYVSKNFGGTYFSENNARKIDAVREEIESIHDSHACTKQEKYILLTSLLFAIDKAANTVGQYDAFLKHIGKEAYNSSGRHLVDSNVYKPLTLLLPELETDGRHIVYNEDINLLASKIDSDVAYLDPPYNHRQYIDNYHVLENIARWEKPPLFGKTKKFDRTSLRSKYSSKLFALTSLKDLFQKMRTKHLFLSYNNEGIIHHNDLLPALGCFGEVDFIEIPYSVFGNGAGQSIKRKLIERLYHCKMRKK